MWKNIIYSGLDSKNNDKFFNNKLQLINTILLIGIFVSFFMAFLFIFIGSVENKFFVITLELSNGALCIALFFFLRYDKKYLNTVIYISLFYLYILQVLIMINLVEDSLREAWFFLTVLLSFFLAGRKFGYFMFSLVFLTILLYNFQSFVDTHLNEVESVLPLILLFLIGLIINLYETNRENYATSLKEVNIKLESKIAELNHFNNNLETRVKDEIEKNIKHELKLAEQSKMAAMGEMLGNIAHQWRQPLSTISTLATGTKLQKEMKILSDKDFDSSMDTINASVQYLSETIEDFRSFFNPKNNKQKEFLLPFTIDKALRIVSSQFVSKDIEIIKDIENISIISLENELIQVILNILNNSKDALLDLENEKRLIFISAYKKEENIIIEIKDNGKGIKKEIINRIFEPYFTTKHQSQGTGIGLYMCENIIVNHLNGTISVSNSEYMYENVKYIGARFIIKFVKE